MQRLRHLRPHRRTPHDHHSGLTASRRGHTPAAMLACLLVLGSVAIALGGCVTAPPRTQSAASTTVAVGPPTTAKLAAQVATVNGNAQVIAYADPTTTSKQIATFGPKTSYGSPRVFLVAGAPKNGLLPVLLPMRPNESKGWIPTTAVTIGAAPYEIQIDRTAKTLTLLKGGAKVDSWPVAVGTGGTPTPDGTFFITDLIKTPNAKGPYGPYAYGLSAYSEVLDNFNGGDGQIGIHGTNNASSIGKDASHGCIRMDNAAITALANQLPLGTPVVIT